MADKLVVAVGSVPSWGVWLRGLGAPPHHLSPGLGYASLSVKAGDARTF